MIAAALHDVMAQVIAGGLQFRHVAIRDQSPVDFETNLN
jgi:hypothetical protein